MADAAAAVPPALDDNLGFHIRLAHGAVYRHFNGAFGAIGLTQKQTSVLWLTAENPGVSQGEIARLLQIDKATMMAIVNTLMRRGFLKREPSGTDQRRRALSLAPAGSAALAEARVAVGAHEAWLRARFSVEEVCGLIGLLRRIHAAEA